MRPVDASNHPCIIYRIGMTRAAVRLLPLQKSPLIIHTVIKSPVQRPGFFVTALTNSR
jgi:hypothetical protein